HRRGRRGDPAAGDPRRARPQGEPLAAGAARARRRAARRAGRLGPVDRPGGPAAVDPRRAGHPAARGGRAAGARPPSWAAVPRGAPPAGRGGWGRWIGRVDRRPWTFAALGTLLLVVVALPVLSLRLGLPDDGTKEPGTSARESYDMITEEFAVGLNGPLLAVVRGPGAEAVAEDLAAAAEDLGSVEGAAPPQVNEAGDAAVVAVGATTGPGDQRTADLVHELRGEVVPGVEAGHPGAEILVGGHTATLIDLSDTVSARLAVFILAVVAISIVLLAAMFRSVLLPLKAA